MNNTIIFLSIAILFISMMLVFTIRLHFDLYENMLSIEILLFGIKVITIKLSLVGLYYQINNSKKLKTISVIINNEQKYLLMQIKKSIIDKLYYDDIIFSSKIGLNDAKNTALSVGTLNLACMYLANKFQNKNSDTILYYENEVSFEKKNFEIDLQLKVYFTIFDLIFAVVLSFYKRGKYVKQKKRKN